MVLTPTQLSLIRSLLEDVVAGNTVSTTFYRKGTVNTTVSLRVESTGKHREHMSTDTSGASEERRIPIVAIVLDTSADIQPEDTTVIDDQLYRVRSINPNRQTHLQIELEYVQ